MSTAFAPIEIGRVALTVNDLPKVARFYEQVIGLHRLSADGAAVLLGAGGRVLLELRGDPAARRHDAREAGLFHTAFLLPTRAALAGWLVHVAEAQVALQGASDHLVSEAIYLADPEGNGIEVYVDRPRSAWQTEAGGVRMATLGLDLNALARSAGARWAGAPDGTVVGHVHLQVGALPEAQAFYGGVIGMAQMAQYPGAGFFGSGGYHHHLAANIWNSRGAGPRAFPATGLAEVELLADPAEVAAIHGRGGQDRMTDPWGTPLRLTPKAPMAG